MTCVPAGERLGRTGSSLCAMSLRAMLTLPLRAPVTPSTETEIEMVRRHVREGEGHVTRQREIVASLPPMSEMAATARELLAVFEEGLEHHRAHLARLLGSS